MKPWLVWDSGNGNIEEYATENEALEFASESLDTYREEAKDAGEWSYEAEHIGVYKLTHDVQETDRDGESVDYGIRDLLSGWINVDDHAPAIGQTVILCINGVVQKETFIFDAADTSDYAPNEYFWSRDNDDECPGVESGQYWMPLPQAP